MDGRDQELPLRYNYVYGVNYIHHGVNYIPTVVCLWHDLSTCFVLKTGQRDDCPTYQIVGDNVDLHQHPTHRSMERKEKDHHWFHLFATRDRITGISLSDDAPTADIATLPLQTFMPSVEECHQLREEFGVLISRVLVEKMAYFSPLKPVVPAHILHKHSDVAKNKSEFVSIKHYTS